MDIGPQVYPRPGAERESVRYDAPVLSAPETYGLDEAQTLARHIETDLPDGFESYWAETREAVASIPPLWRGTLDGPINEVMFDSYRCVRLIARLSLPDGPPRGAVITTHGYDAPDHFPDEHEPWTAHGLIAMRLRVRGYPPSTLDIDDLRGDWITHNLEDVEAWILRGAVADLVQAYRCLRRRFGAALPISLHGESFGGGLAVMAAAQLTLMGDPPHRLVIGLPSLGDWRWRRHRDCNGSGGRINAVLDSLREEGERILERMRVLDAALHATMVRCPVLAKLAARDDVVPAPAAAAIFNAIGSQERWRFPVAFGHFDGGTTDLRRHVAFERLHPAFLDPANDPAMAAHANDDGPAT